MTEVLQIPKNSAIPLQPGYYWAQWRIPTPDTHEGEEL